MTRLDPETFLPCGYCRRQTAHLRQGLTSARILRAAILGLVVPSLLIGMCIAAAPSGLVTAVIVSSGVTVLWFLGWLLLAPEGELFCRQCGTRQGAAPPPRVTPTPGPPMTVAELEAAAAELQGRRTS